jgi:hypothetical protein
VFTRAIHWSLSWATSIQSTPSHFISSRSILILSNHLRLGLPSGLAFPPISYMHSSSPPLVKRMKRTVKTHANYILAKIQTRHISNARPDEIWGSHRGEYWDCGVLWCDAV